MARSLWSGALPLGGPLTLYVEVHSATEKYQGSDSLKQVCNCHLEPFTRTETCKTTGARRLTEEMVKAGKTDKTTPMVMAAEKPGTGEYAMVDKAQLEFIAKQVESAEIAVAACIPREDLALGSICDTWFVQASKKVPGSLAAVAVLYAALGTGRAVIGKWSYRGRQHNVAIIAEGGALRMLRLRYPAESREPSAEILAPSAQTVDPAMVTILTQILDSLPQSFDLSATEDEAITLKTNAVKAAMSGEVLTTPVAPSAPSVVPDLMAQLQAAASATKAGAPKAAPEESEPSTVERADESNATVGRLLNMIEDLT